jgi:hypothetical protein
MTKNDAQQKQKINTGTKGYEICHNKSVVNMGKDLSEGGEEPHNSRNASSSHIFLISSHTNYPSSQWHASC